MKTKKLLKTLFVLVFLFNLQLETLIPETLSAQAPDIEWAKSYGGSGQDWGRSIQQTADGGYIVTGFTHSSESGDVSGQNNGDSDIWVVKTDASGTIEWEENYGGSDADVPFKIKQTIDGGYIVAGNTFSNDGDVGGNYGGRDAWVVKLNSTGDIQWEQNYGGSGGDAFYDIQQTTDGGFILVGTTNSTDGDVTSNNGGIDFWVVKLHSNGNIDWQKTLGGSNNDFGSSIQQTTDGGYILAGYSLSSDGDVGGNYGGRDVWVVKLNSTGDIQWEKNYGGSGLDDASSIQQTIDGGYILAGFSTSSDGDVGGNNGGQDVWVVKLNNTGDIQWEKNFGGSDTDRAESVKQTTDGGYVIAGYSNSTDGDVTGNMGDSDFWVIKLNSSGDLIWEKSMGGTSTDLGRSIQQTSDGGYIVAGRSNSTDGNVSGNNGGDDFWVVKLESTLSVRDNSLPTVSLYPNPVEEILRLKAEKPLEQIELYTLTGQAISITPLNSNPNDLNSASYDLSNLKAGIYFIKITINGQAGTYKVVKR